MGGGMPEKIVIGNATLYHGDCMEVLPLIGKVDICITDPPYELSSSGPGKSHFGMSLGKFDSQQYKDIVDGFDAETLFQTLATMCDPFNLFCFCSNKQISSIMQINEAAARATTLLVWHKVNAAPFANGVWRGDIEYCVHAKSKGAYFQGNARLKKKVSEYPLVNDSAHPTVKPLDLLRKYVTIGAGVGQLVCDPYMGSGTTGIACMELDRRFVGIEKDRKYFDIACERIERAQQQGKLF